MPDLNFDILFSATLPHLYYKDEIFRDLEIVPSVATGELMRGHKMVWKQLDNMLLIGIQTDVNTHAPFIKLTENSCFTFYVYCSNPFFANFTNLDYTNKPGERNYNRILYFTNRNNNHNGKKFLSLPVKDYDNATVYKSGAIVLSGGDVYLNIRKSGVTVQAPPAADNWMKISNSRYATNDDLLRLRKKISVYDLTAASNKADITVKGYDTAGKAYTKDVFSDTVHFPGAVSSFNLDLGALPDGKYALKVNIEDEQVIYLSDEPARNCIAVIDVFHESALPSGYELTGVNDKVLSPEYVISFLNRATIWTYLLKGSATPGVIVDDDHVYTFPVADASEISSEKPIPLRELGLPKLKLTVDGNDYKNIPSANADRLISTSTENYFGSQININY